MQSAHPVGESGNQLIAKFHSRPFRNAVLREGKKRLPKEVNALRVAEDLTRMDYELKKKAIQKMKQAYGEGKRSTFKNGKLIVEGKVVPIPETELSSIFT